MLSGIGDQEALAKHQITGRVNSPEVGKNLQEHVDVVVVNRARDSSIYQDAISFSPRMLWRGLKDSWLYLRKKQGLLSSSLIEAGGFIKSTPSEASPDLQLMLTPALFNDHGRDLKFMMGWGFSIHATLLRPKSRGQVSLLNNNPSSEPNIHLNLLSHKDDYQPLISGIKHIRKIAQSPALQRYKLEEVFPGKDKVSDDELKEFIQSKANHVYHPVGSCRMGNDEKSVVDLNLIVRGTENLRIMDASVFPDQISGNPNATIVAMAAKISEQILSTAMQTEAKTS
jgi:choline dehydrogenase-like flavoprotein